MVSAPRPQPVLFVEECPEHVSPCPEPSRGLCQGSWMAVIRQDGPSELSTDVLPVLQRE